MSRITFKRVASEQSDIYDDDGDCVGEVYRQPDVLNPGSHYYVVHLVEDYRGPVRVFDADADVDAVGEKESANDRYESDPS